MVTVVIMATAVVALVGGIATSVRASDIHRKQAKAQAYLRSFAEKVEQSVAGYPSGYTACTGAGTPVATYKATFLDGLAPADTTTYAYDITAVAYWDSTSSRFVACPGTGDEGVQRVSLRVSTTDGRADERVDIVLRQPCRPPVDAPLNPASYPEGSACV
jgi:hypothetical protein